MLKELFLVVGVKTNYRILLKKAIETGEKYGFDTKILDINSLVEKWRPHPNDWEKLGITPYVCKIESLNSLKSFTRSNKRSRDTIFLFLYPPDGVLRKAWKILQARFPNTGIITLSPVPNAARTRFDKEKRGIKKQFVGALRKAKSFIKPSPAIWVISGSECLTIFSSYFRNFKGTNFIYAHSIEHELYFHSQKNEDSTNSQEHLNYLLVLDQGWFSKPKPDYLTDDQYPPATREVFKSEICSLLHKLSDSLGLHIVVSCHPKADLHDTKEIYQDFKVVNQPSSELIRNCTVALANTSTSIGYAIMADKPLILITSDELSKSVMHPAEKAISDELGIKYLNISSEKSFDLDALLNKKNKKYYKDYRDRYICHQRAEPKPLWDIVFSSLSC